MMSQRYKVPALKNAFSNQRGEEYYSVSKDVKNYCMLSHV